MVHDGLDQPNYTEDWLNGLLRTVAALLSGQKFRFLSAKPGNIINPIKIWEKVSKKFKRDLRRKFHQAKT